MKRPKNFWHGQIILVTGGAGFLGSYVVRELLKEGVSKKNLIIPRSKELDLRLLKNANRITQGVDIVIHLAGNVGGIGKNRQIPGTLLYDNLIMGAHLLETARINKVKKFVCIGTVCSYPKYTPVPFKEEDLWLGYPEETNAPYGLAKKILLVQSQSYRAQYGFNSIYLMPVNLYGPGADFDPEYSHVIPALIKKIVEAKEGGKTAVEVWGDGTPTREFLYVEDAARGIVMATKKYNKEQPINLGSGFEISIIDLVLKIAKILKFRGQIIWDSTKPNGQPRRLLDVSRAWQEFGFKARTPFVAGLKKTIDWYVNVGRKLYG